MNIPILAGAALVSLIIGLVIGKLTASNASKKIEEEAKSKATQLLATAQAEADGLKKDKLLEAEKKILSEEKRFDKSCSDRMRKVQEKEQNVNKQRNQLNQKIEQTNRKDKELSSIRENLAKQLQVLETKNEQVEKTQRDMVNQLAKISGLSEQEARSVMMESLKKDVETQATSFINDRMDEAKAEANKQAKKIIIQTIQRTAAEHIIENSVSVFNLDSDDQKGQIIGREGRNIRALESATGCEIIVDDTPEAIVISGFDPVRREVARLSLQKLVADGRIHPARVEEIVAKTRKQLEEHIRELGERTVIDLGIQGMHRELVRYVGRMRFRSSYGQNLLQHSREVANICATMCAELGLSPAEVKRAKRAGLLHDIGKVAEDQPELSHAIYGMQLCEKYGEHPAVSNAVGAHHDEVEMKYRISPVVQVCDAISGARPGARREISEKYMKRIQDLEDLAIGFEGVEKAYAIQAGRELRVIVQSEKVSDKVASELAFKISQQIEQEMTYPGQVKVTVIREMRAVSVAK